MIISINGVSAPTHGVYYPLQGADLTDSTEYLEQSRTDPAQNVDKIRELLFGGQMREYERRISELEQRNAADQEQQRVWIDSRLSQLESYVKSEIERQSEAQAAKHKTHAQAVMDLDKNIIALEQRLRELLAASDEQNSRDRLGLRHELLEQSRELIEALDAQAAEIKTRFDEQMRRLETDKLGSDELSRLMTEMAMRLSGDFNLPQE
jgi:hypothetical protein